MQIFKIGLIACAAVALPVVAFAQSADVDYCNKLGRIAREYGANTGPVPEAVAKCGSTTAASISTLETHLQAEKIKLPPR